MEIAAQSEADMRASYRAYRAGDEFHWLKLLPPEEEAAFRAELDQMTDEERGEFLADSEAFSAKIDAQVDANPDLLMADPEWIVSELLAEDGR